MYLSPHSRDPALIVRLTGPRNNIDLIEVKDPRFRDATGTHVGSSLGHLRAAYSNLELAVGEGQYCVFSKNTGLSFCLALDRQTEAALNATNGDLSKVPNSTPVNYILVIGKRSGHI
jgi:hypothetical protein